MKRYAFTGSREDRTLMRIMALRDDKDQRIADFARVLAGIVQAEGFDGAWVWYRWQIDYVQMQMIWRQWDRFG